MKSRIFVIHNQDHQEIKMKILKKKALEFQFIVIIIILLILFTLLALWYAGLGESAGNLINSIFK